MNRPSCSLAVSFAKNFLPVVMLLIPAFAMAQDDPNDHIYEAERLVVQKDTMTVTGTVMYVFNELDGDYHIRLRMDSGYVKLSKKNFTRQDSCIILEIVCAHQAIFPISCKCADYVNKVPVPVVGERVKVVGKQVYDKRHKWTELHPVYIMEEIKEVPVEVVKAQGDLNASHKKLQGL
jgi:hypothetical protein